MPFPMAMRMWSLCRWVALGLAVCPPSVLGQPLQEMLAAASSPNALNVWTPERSAAWGIG